jgi:hypothetical protein
MQDDDPIRILKPSRACCATTIGRAITHHTLDRALD